MIIPLIADAIIAEMLMPEIADELRKNKRVEE